MIARIALAGALLVATGALHSAAAQAAQDGKTAYDANCRKCHGVIGTPPKTMKAKYPKIATFDEEFIGKRTDDSVVKILMHGKGDDMKSFKDKMTPDEMKAVAKYVRELGMKSHPSS